MSDVDLDAVFGAMTLHEAVRVAAPVERVWALVADPTRIGEISPEATHAVWLDGAAGPTLGARFQGTNRVGDDVWTRRCTVVELEPGRVFGWEVGDLVDDTAATRWRFALEPEGAEVTVLRQDFTHLPAGRSRIRLAAERHPERAERYIEKRSAAIADGMRSTLARVKELCESGADSNPSLIKE